MCIRDRSAAIDTDLKTWANAQSWKLSDESDVEISDVDYDFDPDNITAGKMCIRDSY